MAFTQLSILKLAGPVCISAASGKPVLDAIRKAWEDTNELQLDFTGVEHLAPPFINAALGWRLVKRAPKHPVTLTPRHWLSLIVKSNTP